jgi:thioredoxin-like negative regulator of GroEL
MNLARATMARLAAAPVVAALLAGAAAGSEPGAHPSRPAGVAWFEGGIAGAFEKAQSEHKPVFLYWGAVWCPPCQELKATIFKRRDFLERLGLFVPVFVDGDAAGAQAIGERFHVSGYPTVLVLRADQTELERVSGGMDLARYAEVLDVALGAVRPAQETLAALSAADAAAVPALGAPECRELAYNAWQLDEAWAKPDTLAALARGLQRAADSCPPELRVERARLQITAVQAAVDAREKLRKDGKDTGADLAPVLARIPPILADRALALAAGDALQGLPAAYFQAAVAADPGEREPLRAQWFALMDDLAQDPRYSAADQMDAVGSKVIAAKALDPAGKVPPALARAVTRRIDDALAREKEPYARASLVNSALNVLDTLGDDARSQAILAGEIKTAAHPYYYMADMGELEEKRGHRAAALQWLARSYETAEGPATRFQWGVGYVRGLVRLQPHDEAAIRAAALAVLGDLDASGDLHGRTRRSLGKLEASLKDWNKDQTHAAVLASVRERLQGICAKMPADDSARSSCASFLANG